MKYLNQFLLHKKIEKRKILVHTYFVLIFIFLFFFLEHTKYVKNLKVDQLL